MFDKVQFVVIANTLMRLKQLLVILLIYLTTVSIVPAQKLSPTDQSFIDDLERRSFEYFWQEADSQTGLVADRARMASN